MRKLFCLNLFALFCAALPAFAQSIQTERPIVDSIEVEYTGRQNISEAATYANIGREAIIGKPYDASEVNKSIRSLYKTGLFDFVEVRLDKKADGHANLIFVLQPKLRVTAVRFKGNEDIKTKQLRKEIKSTVGQPFSEATVNNDINKLYDYYQKSGFTDIQVDYYTVRHPEKGTIELVFDIDEGPKLKIVGLAFRGYKPLSGRDLKDQMKTQPWTPMSWLTGTGRFRDETFRQDLDALRAYYQNEGFLDVEIPEDKVEFKYPSKDKVTIEIDITPGRRYRVGSIDFKGNFLVTDANLAKRLPIHPGQWFSPNKLEEAEETIRDIYGESGYLDTVATATRKPNVQTGAIDVIFDIDESDKFHVESIKVVGNTKSKTNVILRELALEPGDTFDLVRMKNSQARLMNTNFFDEVNLVPEPTAVPGRKNLLVNVKEKRTGQIKFGATFDTVNKIMAFVEVSQSNFDWKNYRSMFQGAGQKARVRFQIGAKSSEFILAFEEPWVAERELAMGFEIFRTTSRYDEADYHEDRIGFEVYARKRIFELVEARLGYGLSSIRLSSFDSEASPELKEEEGRRTKSAASLTFSRDTRDNLIYPTTGSRLEWLNVFAGLGGNTQYYRTELTAARWFNVAKTAEQVFSLGARTGTIMPYGHPARTPLFDRYFMGGPDDLRGYPYRGVGPKGTGRHHSPIGGNTMGFASAEYSFKVVGPLRFALFTDAGFLNASKLNWSLSQLQYDWGFGFRLFIFNAPMRVDIAFPLRGDNKGARLNLAFGAVF